MVARATLGCLHRRQQSAAARRSRARLLVMVAAALVATVALGGLAPTPAQAGGITVYSYQVQEEYTITVDELGNAACKDVLIYDPSFFNKQGYQFEHYPFLLSRRYCDPCDIREIENFDADIDTKTATITITFDQPGKAYNQGAAWEMYGFFSKPKFEVDGAQVFEEESSVNSEFTLWQDLQFKTTTFVRLPAGAQNVRYRDDKHALVWELPYMPANTASFVGRHQGLFVPLGFILLAAGLAGAALLMLRYRARAVEGTIVDTGPLVAGASQLGATPEATSLTTRSTPRELEQPVRHGQARFCANCGEELQQHQGHYCPYCGHPTGDKPSR